MRFLIFFMALVTMIAAKTSSSSTTRAQTTVWRTGTNSEGSTVTTQAIFTPSFMSVYNSEDAETVPAGSVGLGSLTGEVGKIRSYTRTTITSGSYSFKSSLTASDRGMGMFSSVLIGLLSACGLFVMFVF